MWIFVTACLFIFGLPMVATETGYIGPQAPYLLAFWPFDSESGFAEFQNGTKLKNVTIDTKLGVSTYDQDLPGPFDIGGTSLISTQYKPNNPFLYVTLDQPDVPVFTVSFFYRVGKTDGTQVVEWFRLGADYGISVYYIHPTLWVRLKNFTTAIQTNGHAPLTWQFYAFTWNRGKFLAYSGLTAALFANVTYNKEMTKLSPNLVIGSLNTDDQFSCFTLYEIQLTQLEIAHLPCVCKTKGACSSESATLFGKRRFYGPQPLYAYLSLDPDASLQEMASGMFPAVLKSALSMEPDLKRRFLVPSSDDTWIARYDFPSIPPVTGYVTITFYLNCRDEATGEAAPLELLSLDGNLVVNLVSCSHIVVEPVLRQLQITPSNQTTDRVTKAPPWTFIALTYHMEEKTIFSRSEHVKVAEESASSLKNWPKSQLVGGGANFSQLFIGPRRNVANATIACLAIFTSQLNERDISKMRCYCPAVWRRLGPMPDFIQDPCWNQGANLLSPSFMSSANLVALFDDDVGAENLVAKDQQPFIINKNASFDYIKEGPYNEINTSYTAWYENSKIAVYQKLPKLGNDFTVSFYIYIHDGAFNRTLITLYNEADSSDVVLQISSVHDDHAVYMLNYVARGSSKGYGSRYPSLEWSLIVITYDLANKVFSLWDDDGKRVGSIELATTAPYYGTSRLEVGKLRKLDGIACLMTFNRVLATDEIAQLKNVCKYRGRVPDSTTNGTTPYIGPRSHDLVAYWPFDSFNDLANSSRIELAVFDRSHKPNIPEWEPGPFHVFSTSIRANLPSENYYILFAKLRTKPIQFFTASFYFYHELPENGKKGRTKFFRVGNREEGNIEVAFQPPCQITAIFNNIDGGSSKEIPVTNVCSHPDSFWKFYAFTWDGKILRFYFDQSAVSLANIDPAIAISGSVFGATLEIGALVEKDRLSCFAFYDVVLNQLEIARLPCVCKSKGNCTDEFESKIAARKFYVETENLIGFFPMEPLSLFYEISRSIRPLSWNAMIKTEGQGQFFAPEIDGHSIADYQLPQLTHQLTMTFYLFCKTSPVSQTVELVNVGNKSVVKLVSCSKLVVEELRVYEIHLNNQDATWNLVSVKIPRFLTNQSLVSIGPNVSTNSSVGLACLSLFNAVLSDEQINNLACYCPSVGRPTSFVPAFLERQCSNYLPNNLSPPFLSTGVVFVVNDNDTGLENIGNYSSHSWFSHSKIGAKGVFAIYDKLPAPLEFASPYRYADLSICLLVRQTMKDAKKLRVFVHVVDDTGVRRLNYEFRSDGYCQYNCIVPFVVVNNKANDGQRGPEFNLGADWFFHAMTFQSWTGVLTWFNEDGSVNLTVPAPASYNGNVAWSTGSYRVEIGTQTGETFDAISCLFVDRVKLDQKEIAQFLDICRTKGHYKRPTVDKYNGTLFKGPRSDRLVGYWQLDTDLPLLDGNKPEIVTGHLDLAKSVRIKASFFNKTNGAKLVRDKTGPFLINGTSIGMPVQWDNIAPFLSNDLSIKRISEFTVSFYFFNGNRGVGSFGFLVGLLNRASIRVSLDYEMFGVDFWQPNQPTVLTTIDMNYPPRQIWRFYTFTWDGKAMRLYHKLSAVFLGQVQPNVTFFYNNTFDENFDFSTLHGDGDRLACMTFYDVALSQPEIAKLPCLCKMRANCGDGTMFAKKRYYGPQPDYLIGFFSLDAETSLIEVTKGIPPLRMNAGQQKFEENRNILKPINQDDWIVSYNLAEIREISGKIHFTFQLYCEQPIKPVLLINLGSKVDLGVETCSRLSLNIFGNISYIKLDLKNGDWNFVNISFDLPQKLDEGIVRFGPNLKTNVNLACFGLFNTLLTENETQQMECYCPAFGQVQSTLPDFLVDRCSKFTPNLLSPAFLGDAVLLVMFDIDTELANIANFSQNHLISVSKSAMLENDFLGPFNETATSYTVRDPGSFLAIYDNLLNNGGEDFTFSLYFFIGNETETRNRTIFTLITNQVASLQFKIVDGGERTFVNAAPFIDIPSTSLVPKSWKFVAITFTAETGKISAYDEFGKQFQSAGNLADKRRKVGEALTTPFRLEIGPLQQFDRISCLLIMQHLLSVEEISGIRKICQTRGHVDAPVGKVATTTTTTTAMTMTTVTVPLQTTQTNASEIVTSTTTQFVTTSVVATSMPAGTTTHQQVRTTSAPTDSTTDTKITTKTSSKRSPTTEQTSEPTSDVRTIRPKTVSKTTTTPTVTTVTPVRFSNGCNVRVSFVTVTMMVTSYLLTA